MVSRTQGGFDHDQGRSLAERDSNHSTVNLVGTPLLRLTQQGRQAGQDEYQGHDEGRQRVGLPHHDTPFFALAQPEPDGL